MVAVRVEIPCAAGASDRAHAIAHDVGYSKAEPTRFLCKDCRTAWTKYDFCGSLNPETVSCSNCYGDNVIITELALTAQKARR